MIENDRSRQGDTEACADLVDKADGDDRIDAIGGKIALVLDLPLLDLHGLSEALANHVAKAVEKHVITWRMAGGRSRCGRTRCGRHGPLRLFRSKGDGGRRAPGNLFPSKYAIAFCKNDLRS
ncbi:hypothetical protein XAP3CFBP6996_019580 [Xanthomonas citri pv. fuscans CFBP 6996]|nr:hypothetical protein XAP3CFBP6996_019580 [Xanthomonas citri pv. fuscans CFBP 6996]